MLDQLTRRGATRQQEAQEPQEAPPPARPLSSAIGPQVEALRQLRSEIDAQFAAVLAHYESVAAADLDGDRATAQAAIGAIIGGVKDLSVMMARNLDHAPADVQRLVGACQHVNFSWQALAAEAAIARQNEERRLARAAAFQEQERQEQELLERRRQGY